ncbi:hypothetical protein BJV78DRAFT_1216368 [Lactifluus subvellereus]|nr:hypothetical protein BJV78DRAFT_1216368 [Lactifluus subvellereus]
MERRYPKVKSWRSVFTASTFPVKTRLRSTSMIRLSEGDIVISAFLKDVDVGASGASGPERYEHPRKKFR